MRVALNLAHGLRERGHEPRLLALADGFGPTPPADVEGVPARLYPAKRLLPLGFSGITSPPCWPRRAASCGAPTWSTCTSHATW